MKRVRLGSRFTTAMIVVISLLSSTQARTPWSPDKDNDSFQSALVQETVLQPKWPKFSVSLINDSIATVFDCFGTFGLHYTYKKPEPDPDYSFQIPTGSQREYLFGGALWIGGIVGGDTLISVGFSDNPTAHDFTPSNSYDNKIAGNVAYFNSISDYSVRSEFSDTITNVTNPWTTAPVDSALNIVVAERAHLFDSGSYQYGVLYDLVITNVGDQTIEDGYIGIYMDADICADCLSNGGYSDDFSGGLKNEKIAYAHNWKGQLDGAEPLPSAIATRFLHLSNVDSAIANYNWWSGGFNVNYGPRLRGGPEDPFRDFESGWLGTPISRADKYYVLRHREWDYDMAFLPVIDSSDTLWVPPPYTNFGEWYDVRYLLSTGPFTIMPDSSCRIIFTNYAGGDVHTNPDNEDNFPANPQAYLDGLNLDTLAQRGLNWDNLVDDLLDPMTPVVGLKTIVNNGDSTVIEWDPTVVAEVEGYDVYVTPIDLLTFPYPGVIPPWFTTETPAFYQSLPRDRAVTLTGLDHNQIYLVNVANRMATDVGDVGDGLHIKPGGRAPAPIPLLDYAFGLQADSMEVEIRWAPAVGQVADHYNIYRFNNAAAAARKYYAHYDLGEFRVETEPFDSVFANDQYYFYYQMEPLAVVDGASLTFTDLNTYNGAVYSIAAVDSIGFESEFSTNIEVDYIQPRHKDILVVSNGAYHPLAMVEIDSIKAFYDHVLNGYTWDLFNVADSMKLANCPEQDFSCFDWHEFTKYSLTICDDNLREASWSKAWEYDQRGYYKYPHADYRLAHFGSLRAINEFSNTTLSGMYSLTDTILNGPLSADSFYYVGLTHYLLTGGLPTVDSLFGLIEANPLEAGWPSLSFNATGNDIDPALVAYWPEGVAPAVGCYYPGAEATLLYSYNSLYPSSSLMQGKTVGYMVPRNDGANYFFGFHLWYMDETDARALVDKLMENVSLDVVEIESVIRPETFKLYQNYPNPFNPTTSIRYDLPKRSRVRLEIFNLLGQRVTTLVNATQAAGTYRAEWNGRDRNNHSVASGVYFYRITIDDKSYSRKMMMLK